MKTKMKNENVHKDIFSGLWCPLFGELPDLVVSTDSQLNRCVEIILDARTIWEVEGDFPGTGIISNPSNWPGLDEIDYPEWALNSARGIWRLCYHIYYNVFLEVNPILPYIEKPDGTVIENRQPLHVRLEEAVKYARRRSGDTRYAFDDRILDHEIIAILAIYRAWVALRDVLYHGELEESAEIIKYVYEARDLLGKARELEADEYFKELKPDAERGAKQREILQKAREEKKIIVETRTAELQKLWQDKADELWNKNPKLSVNTVAFRLSKESWPVGEESPRTYSKDHIRKLIKRRAGEVKEAREGC